jgi:hypothetical protein
MISLSPFYAGWLGWNDQRGDMTINFGTNPVSLTYPLDANEDLASGHRLIVLIPTNLDFSTASQRIWELAQTTGMHIQLLGLCADAAEESRLRRELITLASLLEDGKRCVTAKIVVGANWLESLKTSYASGDMIVCFEEQSTGFLRKPLSQILEANLKATVYLLSNPAPQKFNSNRLSQISTWLGVIGVVAGFGLLQARIVQLPGGWLQNILLILSIIPEFWLIWFWDSRFG